ncbi:hypothetical protein CHARACLAT_003058 [Characodon lateralis]|uniref:Uncharacterized protein n=1 Tax=Characodon lateralis TaxID=208331 RepID=A0ABU7EHP6_9TELE|nr:hypothetical protein [Characodon lateralis]
MPSGHVSHELSGSWPVQRASLAPQPPETAKRCQERLKDKRTNWVRGVRHLAGTGQERHQTRECLLAGKQI